MALMVFVFIFDVSIGQEALVILVDSTEVEDEIVVIEEEEDCSNCFIQADIACEHFWQPSTGNCESQTAVSETVENDDGGTTTIFTCPNGNEAVDGDVSRAIAASAEAPFGQKEKGPLEPDAGGSTVTCGKILHCGSSIELNSDFEVESVTCFYEGTYNPVNFEGEGIFGDSCEFEEPDEPNVGNEDLEQVEATVDLEHVIGQ